MGKQLRSGVAVRKKLQKPGARRIQRASAPALRSMRVIIRESAEDDLDRIFAWIAKDSPRAAGDVAWRIKERINRLELNALAHMGRPGLVEGTRELIEYPYIICVRSFR